MLESIHGTKANNPGGATRRSSPEGREELEETRASICQQDPETM
jgi:hypothetical protein